MRNKLTIGPRLIKSINLLLSQYRATITTPAIGCSDVFLLVIQTFLIREPIFPIDSSNGIIFESITTERVELVVELFAFINLEGSFELDWQITEETMESSQFAYQEEVYRRYRENAQAEMFLGEESMKADELKRLLSEAEGLVLIKKADKK